MLVLSGTTQTIRLTRSSANAVDVHGSFADNTTALFTPSSFGVTFASAATAAFVTSPAASTQRSVSHVRIFCRGGANTITLDYFDGAAAFQAWSQSFLTGESAEYENGKGWTFFDAAGNVKTTGVGSGRLLRAPQILTSGTTINHPTGTALVIVEGVGGGGAGGGIAAGAGSMGGQGGSGTWGRRAFAAAASSSTYAIGAAGTGVSGAAGNNGGNSTFTNNATTMTLPGGNGGGFSAAAIVVGGVLGGAVATAATNADVSISGQPGSDAARPQAAATPLFHLGPAGSNPLGSGAASRFASGGVIGGLAGTGLGAGGGGALQPTAGVAAVGGNGTAGGFIVSEYT